MSTRVIPLRLDDTTIARLDRLAEVITAQSVGAEANRSSVMREAVRRGIDDIEREFGVKPPKPRPKK